MTTDNNGSDRAAGPERMAAGNAAPPNPTRREVVRRGAKLAFVVPVVATFFARDAYAAASAASCRSPGNACATDADCCGTDICNGVNVCEVL